MFEEVGGNQGKGANVYPEFRREAAERRVSSGKPYAEAVASLGVNESTFAHWNRNARATERKAYVRELEMENEHLKRAVAFFTTRRE